MDYRLRVFTSEGEIDKNKGMSFIQKIISQAFIFSKTALMQSALVYIIAV